MTLSRTLFLRTQRGQGYYMDFPKIVSRPIIKSALLHKRMMKMSWKVSKICFTPTSKEFIIYSTIYICIFQKFYQVGIITLHFIYQVTLSKQLCHWQVYTSGMMIGI